MPNPNHPKEPVKHTPGEWYITDTWRIRSRLNFREIATIVGALGGGKVNFDEEAKANARLIAASPKLLEALYIACEQLDEWGRGENLENVQENNGEAYRICREAIDLINA